MAIDKIEVFSTDGEKNTDGLDVKSGFPREEKPARQWFNYLFNLITGKSNEIITEVNNLLASTSRSEAKIYDIDSSYKIADAQIQNKINSIGGGKKGYITYADMVADKANIPANSSVDVGNDDDSSKNGTYAYNGVTFTKSVYDPLSLAKVYANDNPLFKPVRLESSTNLDYLFTAGIYHVPSNSVAVALGLPAGKSGQIYVSGNTKSTNDGFVFQTHINTNGSVYQRVYNGSVWFTWGGNDVNSVVKIGDQSYKVVTNISELNGNIDNFFNAGSFFINTSAIASTANGFPFGESGGFFDAMVNSRGLTFQRWVAINGQVFRWGSLRNGVPVWTAWSGFKNNSKTIVDLDNIGAANKAIVTYGSSTLAYLADDLQVFADNKGLDFYGYGISGDTIAGTAMLSGANKVTIKVTGGELVKDTYVPVTYTTSFGKHGTNVEFELDNGVTGKLDVFNSRFRATSNATVSPDTVFKATPLAARPSDAIYIINSGKNDVSATEDRTQYIIDKTIEIVKNIPFGADFIVMGHFSDTNAADGETTSIEAINTALKDKYELRYFDVNDILFSDDTWAKLGLAKTAADITAINARRLPPSLGRDNGHLSVAMTTLLAEHLEEKMLQISSISYYTEILNIESNLESVKEDLANTNADLDAVKLDTGITVTPQYEGAIARSLADVNAERISVKSWGAKGDGLTNDAPAIQKAINIAKALNKQLFFPSGTYLLSGIDLGGVSLLGDSAVIMSNGDTTKRYLIQDSTTKIVCIENITIDGLSHVVNNGTWQRGLYFTQNKNVTLRNVSHLNCKGSMLETAVNVKSLTVVGGNILNCTDAHGMIIRSTHNIFNNIAFKDCTEHCIRFGRFNSDAEVDSGKYSVVSNCTFDNIGNDAVLFELNSSHGSVTNCVANSCRSLVKAESTPTIESQRAHHIVATNNICNTGINEDSAAIKLNSAKNCVVSGNIINGYYNGISAGENSTIDNNIIENIQYTSIVLGGSNCTVTNNKVLSASTGISFSNATNAIVTNNTIKNCTVYGANLASARITLSQNNFENNAVAIRLVSSGVDVVVTLNRAEGNTTNVIGSVANAYIKNNFGDLASANIA